MNFPQFFSHTGSVMRLLVSMSHREEPHIIIQISTNFRDIKVGIIYIKYINPVNKNIDHKKQVKGNVTLCY